ncbi:MAG: DUF2846 domain-containing protein [Luteolibacter sp.]
MIPSSILRPLCLAVISASALGLISCASGPTYAEVSKKLPPVPQGKGRVFVYRDASIGTTIKPPVKIDGATVGKSMGNCFFYSDQSPGTHVISITTESKHSTMFNVNSGQPTFIRCRVTSDLINPEVIPSQVNAASGELQIQNCKLASD